jgi:DNA-binding NarL/FixJ family response regulator
MTKIVIAEDYVVVREGIRDLLEANEGLSVVGEAASGRQVLRLLEKHRPDILITNLFLPGTDGLKLVRQIREEFPETRVIILTGCSQEHIVLEALKDGALGYVHKSFAGADLIRGIYAVLRGQRYIKSKLPRRTINEYLSRPKQSTLDAYERLSPREREVMQLLVDGLTNAQIAQRLSISANTVGTHRVHLMKKLGVHNRTELVLIALQRGLRD